MLSPYVVRLTGGREVDLRCACADEGAHVVREELRKTAWGKAANHRQHMQGIEQGIYREASQALLFCGKLTSGHRSILSTIMAGGGMDTGACFLGKVACIRCLSLLQLRGG